MITFNGLNLKFYHLSQILSDKSNIQLVKFEENAFK